VTNHPGLSETKKLILECGTSIAKTGWVSHKSAQAGSPNPRGGVGSAWNDLEQGIGKSGSLAAFVNEVLLAPSHTTHLHIVYGCS
jgi:hypothetical protein